MAKCSIFYYLRKEEITLKKMLYTLVALISISADAATSLTVPFQNIFLNPNQSLASQYIIGAHKLIFCFENNQQTTGIITWPFQGVLYVSSLPIFLKTDPNIEGQFADNQGQITITNNQNRLLIVSCLYGF